MGNKLTSEGLSARLPLLNLKALSDESDVSHERLRNYNYGRIKKLTDEELSKIAKALTARKLLA